MMLSFLHRWSYCWKCEFDTDVKIENYNHHKGEQLLFLKKNAYQKIEQKEGCSCNLYIIALYYCKKRRIPSYLIKTVLKRRSNAIIQHEESWLGWIVIEQVNYK